MKQLTVDDYIITTPLTTILDDIHDALNGSKLKVREKKGDNILVTCPFHNDGQEEHPSCGIYIGNKNAAYGTFNCFTCGKKGSFPYFVAMCFDSSLEYAKSWLIQRYGVKDTEIAGDFEELDFSFLEKEAPKYLDESVLDGMQSYHPYMDKRKLTRKVCEMFKVKYDPKTECLVFPVWDEAGNLCLLTRRSVVSKMFLIDKDKEKPVYLMNQIRSMGLDTVVVCESQINALTLWGWGVPAVATFGCNVTDKQMDIFNHSGLRHVILAFDGDEAGRKGTRKFIQKVRDGILVDVCILPPGKDVNDLTKEEYASLDVKSSYEWEDANGKKETYQRANNQDSRRAR